HEVLDDRELRDRAAEEVEVGLELGLGAVRVLLAEIEARAQVEPGVEAGMNEVEQRRAHLGVALALVEPLAVEQVELRADVAPAPPDEHAELELARRLGEAEVLVLPEEPEVDLVALLRQDADTHAHRRVDAVDPVLVIDADAQRDAMEQLT